jgi:hypothetical protein
MRLHFWSRRVFGLLFFAAVLCASFAELSYAASDERYVAVLPGPTCSIKVDNVSVKSFRILIPARRLKDIANSTAVITVHVCECFLQGGDQKECAFEAVTKAARQVQVSREDAALLGDRIFVFLQDPNEFVSIYSALTAAYPTRTSNIAWHLLRDLNPATSTAAAGGTGGTGGGRVEPPLQPPPDGPKPIPPILQEREKKRSCEIEPNVCINPKTNETSAEFEMTCEGFPPIVFSTDGKAGFKIGPVEVSISVGGGDKH